VTAGVEFVGAMADVGDVDDGIDMSDQKNDHGVEAHLIASKRRAGLSNWLRVSTLPHAAQLCAHMFCHCRLFFKGRQYCIRTVCTGITSCEYRQLLISQGTLMSSRTRTIGTQLCHHIIPCALILMSEFRFVCVLKFVSEFRFVCVLILMSDLQSLPLVDSFLATPLQEL
jgi:hypothetical protein